MDRWVGRVAVVTGASAGIGKAIAGDLVRAGLKVVGLARRKDRLDALALELINEKGEFHPFQCDVSKENEIKAAFQYVNTKLNGVDILINNAGIIRRNSLLDGPTEHYRPMLEINLLAYMLCINEAYQSMKMKGVDDGHIININSISGHRVPHFPHRNIAVQSATKHGVTAITEALRYELLDKQSKIRITSITPGFVKTEMTKSRGADNERKDHISPFPALDTEDMTNAILYVLSTPPHVQESIGGLYMYIFNINARKKIRKYFFLV